MPYHFPQPMVFPPYPPPSPTATGHDKSNDEGNEAGIDEDSEGDGATDIDFFIPSQCRHCQIRVWGRVISLPSLLFISLSMNCYELLV